MNIILISFFLTLAFSAPNFNSNLIITDKANGAEFCKDKLTTVHKEISGGDQKVSINLAGYTPPADDTTTESSRLLEEETSTNDVTGITICGYASLQARSSDGDEIIWIGGAVNPDTSKTGVDFMK